MLQGYNCTVFAYGQTGTGKTYTMSGDMTDTLGLLSDAAGIIPRVLYSLFRKLEGEETESSVKCSFIELYNEELRDLLAVDDNTKLKLFEDGQKKGHSATIVQGMEESYIKTAQEGVKLLQEGSHKRQVAATKCNDLSSRSHTVFTVTVYTKRITDSGEDFVSSGKLNLVDLAGSENIQRSGAENKRATEAGLINKSLLTLGRVINALVDRSSHIPYRESKLTRLLQDSLGGRTKTCIIATISPAKSNLEETISTLDYAFRAKNIRNKPQMNQMISKKTLLKEFTAEIEKLKSELIATRQRNGVHLTNETYEHMMVESESRRILTEEQKAKIETMEANLRNKVQELFNLTSNFANLKKDNEATRQELESTTEVLRKTEIVLADTEQNLKEENILRKAHQTTEEQLNAQGEQLINALEKTVKDVDGLRAKIRRKSDLQSVNRTSWQSSQDQVSTVTKIVENRVEEFQSSHKQLVDNLTTRLQEFIGSEFERISDGKSLVDLTSDKVKESKHIFMKHAGQAQVDMNDVLEEIKVLREDVKTKVGTGLQGLSAAAGRISAGVIEELDCFHNQLNDSYRSLGKEMKSVFEELTTQLKAQKSEADDLRQQLTTTLRAAQDSNNHISMRLNDCLHKEREQANVDRQQLISQITDLINASSLHQEQRMTNRIDGVREELAVAKTELQNAEEIYSTSMDAWLEKEASIASQVIKAKDDVKKKLQDDWQAVEQHSNSIETTTKSVHGETVRIVEAQMKDMTTQMQALDDFVERARNHNDASHRDQSQLFEKLTEAVLESLRATRDKWISSKEATEILGHDITEHESSISSLPSTLSGSIQQPLSELRENILSSLLVEYTSTGETPQKTAYNYSKTLSRTKPHEELLGKQTPTGSDENTTLFLVPDLLDEGMQPSPSKTRIYTDVAKDSAVTTTTRPATADGIGLREVDSNVNAGEREYKTEDLGKSIGLNSSLMGPPPAKRLAMENTKLPRGSKASRAEGRENSMNLSSSLGPGTGRRLRSSVRNES
jgi:kinesin family member 11